MIRTFLVTGASAIALFAASPVMAEEAAEAEIATPTMNFGDWGFDPAGLDAGIDPGDDFFAYVNAKWLAANPLPAEFSRFGAFNLLREKSTSDVKTLVDELVAQDGSLSADEQRIVDAYKSYIDSDAIEAAGLALARPHLNDIFSARTMDSLVKVWSQPGMSSPIGGFVTVDQKQPDTYVTYIGTGGLGLPDRDYYLGDSEKDLGIQIKYIEYLTFLAKEAGYSDPERTAQAVYGFEDRIARVISWDRAVSRNRDLTYNAVTPAELVAMAGEFPVTTMLKETGFDKATKFVVPQMPPTEDEIAELGLTDEMLAKIGKGTPGMFEVMSDTPIATLQAWTALQFLSGNSDVLPSRFEEANFEFFGKTLRGQPEQRPRWKRAIDETEGHLGEVLGKSYVARYFPEENKAAMDELVANLGKAMAQSIDEIDWMGDATKEQAMAKLNSFDPKIGYRDNLETYEGLTIVGDNPIANRMSSAMWGFKDNLAKLGAPIDRTEWFMLPQTVNAYYNATKNEIVFPAAILQQPFFGISADPAVNYGAIGGVIGHEMGHGFDDQGSKSDATGELRNWWTDADRTAFDKRGDALVEQYNAFCPLDDGKTCVNGRFTLGENIGDLGGLSLAYRAYKLSLNGAEDAVIDGLTGDQRFFLAWAQVWRSQQREDNARQRLRTDSHSPEEYRVNGVVRNMDAWYDAFGITPDDDMYLPPEERITIW
ncbi:M13 family metallopeptidase [Pontixanthobacter gangjinensis]|uniref:M13 family peptidase n=1 Tax=Pontixanthobacter gangjinensis TaxID=1028742 RepID=A0A6I4SJH8_9SPHN|nr:M13 family metallopeptidase [Pontixanthobacter gangjinensis]MXO55909.1 M13 family peptidase [Pontixanthobacter gangjinensis]